jgi:hypothetical protein
MTNYQPYNEYKDLKICACMGPQGNDPVCPCAMVKEGKTPSAGLWTEKEQEAMKNALRQIFEEKP